MTEALDAARSAYSKWYTIQSRVAVLANAFLIIAQPVKLSTVSDVIVLGGAASTYYCPRPRVLKCKKSELLVMYQLYALCCPRRHAPLLRADVMMPAFAAFATRADGTIQQDHYVIATFVSMFYGCISAKATTCANTYGELAVPLKKKRE